MLVAIGIEGGRSHINGCGWLGIIELRMTERVPRRKLVLEYLHFEGRLFVPERHHIAHDIVDLVERQRLTQHVEGLRYRFERMDVPGSREQPRQIGAVQADIGPYIEDDAVRLHQVFHGLEFGFVELSTQQVAQAYGLPRVTDEPNAEVVGQDCWIRKSGTRPAVTLG